MNRGFGRCSFILSERFFVNGLAALILDPSRVSLGPLVRDNLKRAFRVVGCPQLRGFRYTIAMAACDQFRCVSQLVITILSIRGSAGGLYYSLDGGQCGSIQMRIIYDLTLHSLTFGFQVLLEVLERRR